MFGYCTRRLQPFLGTIRTIEEEDRSAAAITLNGTVWHIELRVATPPGGWSQHDRGRRNSTIPFAYWSPTDGVLRRFPLPPPHGAGLRDSGEDFIARLEAGFGDIDYPLRDRYELWLLDDRQQLPLALLDSTDEPVHSIAGRSHRWLAYGFRDDPRLAPDPAWLEQGAALKQRVERLINGAGRRGARRWYLRTASGEGIEQLDPAAETPPSPLPPPLFPSLCIREQWPDTRDADLVAAYQQRLAPRLLTLPTLTTKQRRHFEQAAWNNHLLVHYLHPLYPEIIDQGGLKTARVKAQLELSNAPSPSA